MPLKNQQDCKTFQNTDTSFNRRIFGIVTFVALALLTYFLISDYFTTINHAENLAVQHLQGVVRDLAERIDGDQHKELTNNFLKLDDISSKEQEKNYQEIHKLLNLSLRAHSLSSPIYTFIKSNTADNELQFVATSSEVPYFRHKYTSFPKDAYAKLDMGGALGLYQDEYGHWLSAFAPIKNTQGEVIAYVQADEKFDDFIALVRAKTFRNALFCLLGLFLVGFLCLPFLRKTLKAEEEQKALLKKSLKETQRLSGELEMNEQKLKDYAAQLEMSNQDLTDFAHIASHDLKAPIRNIKSFAELIKRRSNKNLDESTSEYLNFIINSASQATNLITGLLSYSTVDKDLGEQVVFNLAQASNQAQRSLTTAIEERNAEIIINQMPMVEANPILVSQVFQNLINNGIKYNQSEIPIIEIGVDTCERRGNCFYVKDNGIGIPEEYKDKVFKMFTRLHSSKDYEGSGIGLAFCNRVINSYGGTMWLESQKDQGSTFFFNLPNATINAEEPVLV